MREFLKGLIDPATLRDAAGIGSISAISYGAWSIYHPAGWITGGTIVLALVGIHVVFGVRK